MVSGLCLSADLLGFVLEVPIRIEWRRCIGENSHYQSGAHHVDQTTGYFVEKLQCGRIPVLLAGNSNVFRKLHNLDNI